MSGEDQEVCKEMNFANDDKNIPGRMGLHTAPFHITKSPLNTDWKERVFSEKQITTKFTDFHGGQGSEIPNVNENISHNLEGYYVTCPKKSNIFPEEQPLDFSKKIKIDKVSKPEHTADMNSVKNSDCINNSTNGEVADAYLTNNTHERGEKRYREDDISHLLQCKARISWNAQAERSQRIAASSLGLAVDHYYEHSVPKSIGFEQTVNSHAKLPHKGLLVEVKHSANSLQTSSKIPHVPNDHLQNSPDYSTGRNDSFLIRGILNPQSTKKVEPAQTHRELKQINTSPQSTSSRFGNDEKPYPDIISPNQSKYLPYNKFSVRPIDGPHDTNGIYTPCVPIAFPPRHFSNFVHHTPSRDMTNYAGQYSYHPGSIVPPALNSLYAHTFQQALHATQEKQRPKEQRPFKTIDPNKVLSEMPLPKSAEILKELNSVIGNGSLVPAALNSSPNRLSPDSPCLANVSSSNSNDPPLQDTNGEPDKKKIRRIPPEERDEKYLEKRRKNNLAAKKSRDERRKKEDTLALSLKVYESAFHSLIDQHEFLKESLKEKEMRLDLIKANLITFREKCDGSTRELFEETFRIFLPQF